MKHDPPLTASEGIVRTHGNKVPNPRSCNIYGTLQTIIQIHSQALLPITMFLSVPIFVPKPIVYDSIPTNNVEGGVRQLKRVCAC